MTTQYQYKNNAVGQLTSTIPPSATTIGLSSGQGALFPALTAGQTFYLAFTDLLQTRLEVVLCTAIVGDVFTVTRAQLGTSAKTFYGGDYVSLRVMDIQYQNFTPLDNLAATTGALLVGVNPTSTLVSTQLQAALTELDTKKASVSSISPVVSSIGFLRLLLKTGPANALVTGYYAFGDGGGGQYYLDLSDTTSGDNGGTIIVAADGGRWKMQFSKNMTLTVNQFGARGLGGATDDTVFIQNAIAYKDSIAGGEIQFLPGTYNITVAMFSYKGVLLKAQQANDYSTNTNGSGLSTVTIRWTGAASPTTFMYTVKPATIGYVVWGGGSDGIEWDCNALSLGAVHFDNTKNALFDGKIFSPTFYGVLISSISGSPGNFSQLNKIRRLEFVYGYTSASDSANALVIVGNGTNVPGTQHQIGVVQGLINNGYAVTISETDNCSVDYINMARLGTGGSLRFTNGGAQPPNSNVVKYVAGKVDFGSTPIYGNKVVHCISEGGGFVGSGQWDSEILDYVSGKMFKSHVYQMRKWIQINSGDWSGDANTVQGNWANIWPALNLPKAAISKVSCVITPDYDLANGNLVTLEFQYSTNSNTGGNLELVFAITTITNGTSANAVNPILQYTVAIPQSVQYVATKYSFAILPNIVYNIGDLIAVSVKRLPADPNDTATGEVYPLGLRLNYQSLGPDSPGSGTYAVPNWT